MIPSALMIAGIGYFLYSKISQKLGSTRSSKVAAISEPRLVALRSDGYHPDLGLTASEIFPEISKNEDLAKYLEYRDLWFPTETCFTTPEPAKDASKADLQEFCLKMWLEMHFWVYLITHPEYGVQSKAWKYKTGFDNNVPDQIRRLDPRYLNQLARDNKHSVRLAYQKMKDKAA